MNRTARLVAVVIAGFLTLPGTLATDARAGELEPPGPPGPTMLPLDQVEPRTPISDADMPKTITAPGAYYLVENIDTEGGGITIAASDVTLDLMGFTLAGGAGDGIHADPIVRRIVIRNGVVSGWSEDGIDLGNATNSLVVEVRAEGNGGVGIDVSTGTIVRNCTAGGNQGGGFSIGAGSTLTDSAATDNLGDGIAGGVYSTIHDCVATGNTGDGIDVQRATIRGSSAHDNRGHGIEVAYGSIVEQCSATYNDGDGIRASSGAKVESCVVQDNGLDGISVSYEVLVLNNVASANGRLGDGAGIHVFNTVGARIDGNLVSANDRGIYVFRSGNVVVRNSATGNTAANYDIAAGNAAGAIVSDPAAAGPWDNIEF